MPRDENSTPITINVIVYLGFLANGSYTRGLDSSLISYAMRPDSLEARKRANRKTLHNDTADLSICVSNVLINAQFVQPGSLGVGKGLADDVL